MRTTPFLFISCIFILASCSREKTNDLIPFSDGKLWGYADRNGNTAIEKQFTAAGFFSQEGLAPVADQNSKWGFIDSTGTFVIQPQYEEANRFSEGLACVKKGDDWGFVSIKGEMVIPHQYSYPGYFVKGLACVAKGAVGSHEWGFIDPTGKEIIPFKYQQALPFDKNGYAAVNQGKWFFINSRDQFLCPDGYETDESGRANEMFFSEGLARVKKNGLFGFIDDSCREVIAFKFDFAGNFSEGMAAVRTGDKWGYIDKSGNTVIEPRYYNALKFTEGLAMVTNENELSGYIDNTGKEVLPITYSSASAFINGVAIVKNTGNGYFLIDKTGKKISNEYDMMFTPGVVYCPDGMFHVWKGSARGFIDNTGKEFF